LGDGVLDVFGSLAAAGDEDAGDEGVHGSEFGVCFEEEAVAGEGESEESGKVGGVVSGDHGGDQDR
jgi:hypothetical protein